MRESPNEHELYDLLSAWCDGILTPEQTAQLQAALIAEPRARTFYVDFMHMQNSARYLIGSGPHSAAVDCLATAHAAVSPRDAGELAAQPRRRSLRPAWSAIAGSRWTTSLCVALLFVAAMLLGLSILRYGPHNATRDANPRDALAPFDAAEKSMPRVVAAQRCLFEGKRRLFQGEKLPWGTSVELRRGVLCVEYPCGARMIAEGETHFTPIDAASARLQLGRLSVSVPPQASGFAVATPTMRIVDISTEFGAYVDARGNSEVHVFTGVVELHPPSESAENGAPDEASPRDAPKVVVREGIGWRVEAGEASSVNARDSENGVPSVPLSSFGRAIEPRAHDFLRRVPREGTFARGAPNAEVIRELQPALWLDATHDEGVETRGAAEEVVLWRDLSGHNRHASPEPRSLSPQTAVVRLRGKSYRVLQFGEENVHSEPGQALLADWIPPRGDYTGFVVAATREGHAAFLAQDAPGFGNLDASFGVGIQNAYRNRPAEGLPTIAAGALTLETHGPASDSGSSGASLETPRANDGRLRIFSFRVRGARYEVGNNGRLQTNEALQTGAFGGNGNQPLAIGVRQAFASTRRLYLRGQIAEIVMFSRALEDEDFRRAGRELGVKYDIAGAFAPEE